MGASSERNIDVRVFFFLSVQDLRCLVVLLVLSWEELFWPQHVFSVLTLVVQRVAALEQMITSSALIENFKKMVQKY